MTDPNWTDEDEQDLKTTEALLAYAWKTLDYAAQQFARIDSKAASIAGFVGVSATVLVAVTRSAFPSPEPASCLYTASRIGLVLLILSLLVAFAMCLCALFPRQFTQLPRIPRLVGEFIASNATKQTHRMLLKQTINQAALTEESMYSAAGRKEVWLRRAAKALWFALAFGAASCLLFVTDSYIHANAYQRPATTETNNPSSTPTETAGTPARENQTGGTKP